MKLHAHNAWLVPPHQVAEPYFSPPPVATTRGSVVSAHGHAYAEQPYFDLFYDAWCARCGEPILLQLGEEALVPPASNEGIPVLCFFILLFLARTPTGPALLFRICSFCPTGIAGGGKSQE
jgi:hypothetical protein